MKTILITGAGGFIGGHLQKYLARRGFAVIAAGSRDYNFADKKTVAALIAETRPDILLLAGFYGIEDAADIPADIAKVNLKIFKNFTAAAGGKIPVITFGSGAEFDKSKPIKKARESSLGKNIPKDSYGRAKYLLAREIAKHPNACNLRLFGVYGPGEAGTRFITHAVKQNLRKKPITMRRDVSFDYLYIKDLCRIVEAFINNPPGGKCVNMTPDKSIKLSEICAIINEISPFKSAVKTQSDGMANEYSGDNRLLKKLLPGFVFTPYKKGIKEFYNHLKAEEK